MLYTLHSYILRELGKIFLVGAVVLTLILSLGGLLQPLRSHGVSAMQLFQLIFYFFPVMMTFSLPVAALLSATLVYGRLSADNELTACRASGIGLGSLVLPPLLMGVAVLAGTLLLSNWLVPRCAQQAADIIKEDIQDIAYNKLKKGNELAYGSWIVTAVRVLDRDPGRPNQMNLFGVAMAEVQRGLAVRYALCSSATLLFNLDENTVTVFPRGVVGVEGDRPPDPRKGETDPTPAPPQEPAFVNEQPMQWKIRPFIKDDVSFKSYQELVRLYDEPWSFYNIADVVADCRRLTEHNLLYREIAEALASRPGSAAPGAYLMRYENYASGRRTECDALLEADAVTVQADQGRLTLGQPAGDSRVRITLLDAPDVSGNRRPLVRYTAVRAVLSAASRQDVGLSVDVKFPGPFTRHNLLVGSAAANQNANMTERLLVPRDLEARVAAMPVEQLDKTGPLRKALRDRRFRLQQQIAAQLHSRGAFSVAALVLVLLGTALGIIFRSGHVLVAFGVAAVPAMLTITLVITGKHIATSQASAIKHLGLMIMWSGNAVVALLTAVVYWFLMRR